MNVEFCVKVLCQYITLQVLNLFHCVPTALAALASLLWLAKAEKIVFHFVLPLNWSIFVEL